MSGVKILASRETKKLLEVKVNDQKIDLTKKYSIALPEFIAGGGDKYPKLTYRKTGFVDADILKDFILERKLLKSSEFLIQGYVKFE
jgi:5'-nucleotidase/UDP-sugar diphosphatase